MELPESELEDDVIKTAQDKAEEEGEGEGVRTFGTARSASENKKLD